MTNPLLKQIEWQDLRHLSAWQVAYNVILPYPFLALSWWAFSQSHYGLAVIGSYFFVITAYRQGHDIFHQALGLPRRLNTGLLFLISIFSFTSLHSMKYSHLLHHRQPLSDGDTEGYLAKLSWCQALAGGLLFRYRLYKHGFALTPNSQKPKLIIESLAILAMTVATFVTQAEILLYQFVVMFVMNAFAGVIAVWALHHDCEPSDNGQMLTNARTERHPLVNALSFNLFYHAEHHLFPAVPTQNLPKLAERLDKVAPQIRQYQVVGFGDNRPDDTCPIRRRFA